MQPVFPSARVAMIDRVGAAIYHSRPFMHGARRGARHERPRRPYICFMDPTRPERLLSEDRSPSARANGPAAPPPRASAWRPFRHPAFTVIWTASLAANTGTWMYTAASSWLMTSLSPDPLIVSLVQVAASLPIFLLAIPAGALADIIDRRRFLIIGEAANTAIAAVFAVLVWLNLVTAAVLLLFTLLISAFGAFTAPAWQAVTPQLVPKPDLRAAIAANSIGFNLSRAIGPALGGALAAVFGIASPFWINAASNLGINGGLIWWHPPRQRTTRLPAERFVRAIRTGLRYARYNLFLRATLLRAIAFFLFASAYWALLPLVARDQIAAGPGIYGVLVGAIGAGAIGGVLVLPHATAKLGPDRLVAAGTLGTALALVLFGLAHDTPTALVACLLAGAAWIVVLSSPNVSAQLALPEWVRARGLAIFMTVYFGAHTAGSALWGQVGAMWGLPIAHFIAAAAALLCDPDHLALASAVRRQRRSHALAALGRAGREPRDRGRSRAGTGDGRVSGRSGQAPAVPCSTRPPRPRAPARRRLSLGRVRGCGRPITLRRDVFGR